MNIDDYFNINESSHAILYKSKNLIFSCKFFLAIIDHPLNCTMVIDLIITN